MWLPRIIAAADAYSDKSQAVRVPLISAGRIQARRIVFFLLCGNFQIRIYVVFRIEVAQGIRSFGNWYGGHAGDLRTGSFAPSSGSKMPFFGYGANSGIIKTCWL
jgi:hypothetical protein